MVPNGTRMENILDAFILFDSGSQTALGNLMSIVFKLLNVENNVSLCDLVALSHSVCRLLFEAFYDNIIANL